MATRDREEQARQERERLEREQQEQQERMSQPRAIGDDVDGELSNNPIIINR
jgi:hypothetical protein